jgi:hypothetical protein
VRGVRREHRGCRSRCRRQTPRRRAASGDA